MTRSTVVHTLRTSNDLSYNSKILREESRQRRRSTFRGDERNEEYIDTYIYRSMLGTRNESTVNVEFIVQGFVIRCAYTCQKPTFRARLLGMLSPSIGRIDSSPYEMCASIYRFLNYKMYDARRIRYAANRNRTRINLCMLRSRYVKASSFFVNVAHVPILLLFPQLSVPEFQNSPLHRLKALYRLNLFLRLRNSKDAFTFHLDDTSHKSFSICASQSRNAF